MRRAMGGLCVLGLTVLGGCAYVPIQDHPDGSHSLIATAKSGGYTVSRDQALEDANDYCARSRKRALVESYDDLPAAGLDAPHSSRLNFSCTDS
jgi:hypothetical protein